MTTKTQPGITQEKLFPIAAELADAGHLLLAMKVIVYATRVDIAIIRRRKALDKHNNKILNLMAKSFDLEHQACAKLHDHSA
jgi:hypothetical protein